MYVFLDGIIFIIYYPPEVMGAGSIHIAILPSCQVVKDVKDIALYLGSKNKKHLRGSTRAPIHPLTIILTTVLWALVSVIA